ncbi:ZNF729 [Branchiostoma lanceolatum]|uniref:ZNF729 protein n=1 Tax=Branchiostoma lanceolatum TaxID=7740 RepID=A0A8J9YNI4_BRALA|nr:ZNF729 [Branchiostoma lanceolatum]
MGDHNAVKVGSSKATQPFTVHTPLEAPDFSSYIETIYRCKVCQFLGNTTEAVTEHLKSTHLSQSLDHSYAGGWQGVPLTEKRQTGKVSDEDSEPSDNFDDDDSMPPGVAASDDDDDSPNEVLESLDDISPELPKKKKMYRCSTAGCRLRFPTQEQRDLHEQCHVQGEGASDGSFRCPTCQVNEGTWEDMMVHLGSHTCVFHLYCVVCNCGFSSSVDLDRHLAAVHGVNQPNWPLHYKQVHTWKFHLLKQKFGCPRKDCKSYFFNQEDLDIHKKCHVDKKPHFKCYICGQVATTWPSMKAHFLQCHRQLLTVKEGVMVDSGTEVEAVAKPLFIFKEETEVTNGNQENRQSRSPQVPRQQLLWFPCTWKGCEVGYSAEEQLKLHQRCHLAEGDSTVFQCPFCETGPTDWEAMQDHITKHTDLLNVTCEGCNWTFPTMGQLDDHFSKQHMKINSLFTLAQKQRIARKSAQRRKRKYKCENCKKAFFFKEEDLRTHEQCHIEASPDFRCYVPDCTKAQDTFGDWIKMKSHLRSAHKVHIAAKEKPYKPKKQKYDNLPTMCDVCGKVFCGRRNLTRHMKSHREPLKCPQCPKFSTKRPNMLRAHMEKHRGEGKFHCKQCGYFAPVRADLKNHMEIVHSEVKPYMCDLCGKFFKFLGNLSQHRKVIHSDARPFSCTKCNHTSKTKEALNRHNSKVHSDSKMTCPHCGFSTHVKSVLEKHMDLHSEDRQHKCPQCTYGFKESNALKRHMEEVHAEKPLHHCSMCSYSCNNHIRLEEHEMAHLEARYNCNICEFKSKWRASLFRHYKVVHNIQKPVVKLAKVYPASDSNIIPSSRSLQTVVASEATVTIPVTSTGEVDGATAILMGLAYGAGSSNNIEEYVKTVDWR